MTSVEERNPAEGPRAVSGHERDLQRAYGRVRPAGISLAGVTKRFDGKLALDGITLDVPANEVVVIVGPSGSGKSTLLKVLGGHEQADSGTVLLDGVPIHGLSAHEIPAATVFQNYALFPHLDVAANVGFGLKVRGWKQDDVAARVRQLLSLVHLDGFEARDVTTLSGGEKQRVATVRALAVRPQVLLMDEPLGALDRVIRLKLQRELRALLRRLDITAIYVTHNQEEAFALADRIVILHRGRVEQVGSPADVYRRPANRFVAEFIGGTNLLPGVVKGGEGTANIGVEVGGRRIECAAFDQQFVAGERADVAIKPEDVRVTAATGGDKGDGLIQSVSFTGETTEYEIALSGGVLLRAKELGLPRLAEGARVRTTWNLESPLVLKPNHEPT